MLRLSADSMRALGAGGRHFETELVAHCERYAPELSRIVGHASLHAQVASWIERAAAVGFTTRGATRLFAELVLTFGSSFDTDPQLPWVAPVLGDTDADEMDRARGLFVAATEYLEETAGPDDLHSLTALRRVRQMAGLPETDHVADEEGRIVAALRYIHPHKARVVGERGLRDLVAEARRACRRHDLFGDGPPVLLTGMMFGFGHGVASDPLYPWVARTLRRAPGPDGDLRTRHLARKVMIYVDHMLAVLGPSPTGALATAAALSEPGD